MMVGSESFSLAMLTVFLRFFSVSKPGLEAISVDASLIF